MAYYEQNAPQEWPRNGTAPQKNSYPRSATVYAPSMLPMSETNPGSTAPSSGFRAEPVPVVPYPVFGRHDGLDGKLMAVAQSDLYDSSQNPWPATGTYEEPGAAVAVLQMIRLQPTTSAHPGLQASTGAGPTMLFQAPPVFSIQTKPIYAVGL